MMCSALQPPMRMRGGQGAGDNMKKHYLTPAATGGGALLLLLTLGAPRASANIVTYQLTSDHCTGGCLGSGDTSAGTITVTDVSGGVTIGAALNSGYMFVNTGFNAEVGFNLDVSSITSGTASPN